jgi:hypothetical protein
MKLVDVADLVVAQILVQYDYSDVATSCWHHQRECGPQCFHRCTPEMTLSVDVRQAGILVGGIDKLLSAQSFWYTATGTSSRASSSSTRPRPSAGDSSIAGMRYDLFRFPDPAGAKLSIEDDV